MRFISFHLLSGDGVEWRGRKVGRKEGVCGETGKQPNRVSLMSFEWRVQRARGEEAVSDSRCYRSLLWLAPGGKTQIESRCGTVPALGAKMLCVGKILWWSV